MIRDTQRSARCVIKLASVLRKRAAMGDLGKKILGHGLVGAGGGFVIGSTVGKDNQSPLLGAGLGAIAGGVGGATDYYVRKAQEAKILLEEDKLKKEVAELSKRLGINPTEFAGLTREEIVDALKKGTKGPTDGIA